jgi:hypothetical protein
MTKHGVLDFVLFSAFIMVSVALFPALGNGNIAQGSGLPPPRTLTANPAITDIIKNISKPNLYTWNYELQNMSTRFDYSKKFNDSTNYTFDKFSGWTNLKVEKQEFIYDNHVLNNVIATLPGMNESNKTVFIVGGHYDSIQYPASMTDPEVYAPGADDDGSGTVVTMELARLLSKFKFENTIIFGLWAAEEVGLVGSSYYAKYADFAGMDIGGYLNFDMVGNDANIGDTNYGVSIGSADESLWLSDYMTNVNTEYNLGLTITPTAASGSSDHAPFLAHGFPAIECAETDFSPNWHKISDTVDNMSFDLVEMVAKLAAASVCSLAGLKTPGLGMVSLDRNAYRPDGNVRVSLYDTVLNLDPGLNDTAQVTVTSTSDPAGKSLSLNETNIDSSVFAGTISLSDTNPPPPGKLLVKGGDIITAEFIDYAPVPPETRTAIARIDNSSPALWNISVVPQVDVATVYLDTDEIANAKVLYGNTTSLGQGAAERGLQLAHEVFVYNLEPDTVYYFDVQVTDEAGNPALDNNGGMHYAFTTILGATSRPGPGYAYWVRENKDAPGGTAAHVDGGLRTGFGSTYKKYHGAFQVNFTEPPAGCVVTNASVSLYGQGWYSQTGALGLWRLEMLASTIDNDFPRHNYWQIEGAIVEAPVPPMLDDFGLHFKEWNTFYYTKGQYPLLESHLKLGKISFRLDGPVGPKSKIYSWDSGYGMDSAGYQYAPIVALTYTNTGDVTGPVSTALELDPNPAPVNSTVTLKAHSYDTDTGGSKIVSAEFFVGNDPGIAMGIPMMAQDNAMTSPAEDLRGEFNVSSLAPGSYPVSVRARDSSGNWGPVAVTTLHVVKNALQNYTWSKSIMHVGWNFVSFPVFASGTPGNMLQSLAGKYDRVLVYCPDNPVCPWREFSLRKPPYLNEMMLLDNSAGFWVNITVSPGLGSYVQILFEVTGCNLTNSTYIALKKGWNMIGYPSLDTGKTVADVFKGIKYDSVMVFNATAPHRLAALAASSAMLPGEAYWVHVSEDALLKVKY